MSKETKKSDTHEERYIHLDVDGPRIKKMTVFARKEGDMWYASFSFCHVSDQFDRKIGRQAARRRYFNPSGVKMPMGKEFTYEAALGVAKSGLALV